MSKKFEPLTLSMVECVWGADEKTALEQFDKGRVPVLGFRVFPNHQECTMFIPVDYVARNDALTIATNIGKIVSDELMLCGFKVFNPRNN